MSLPAISSVSIPGFPPRTRPLLDAVETKAQASIEAYSFRCFIDPDFMDYSTINTPRIIAFYSSCIRLIVEINTSKNRDLAKRVLNGPTQMKFIKSSDGPSITIVDTERNPLVDTERKPLSEEEFGNTLHDWAARTIGKANRFMANNLISHTRPFLDNSVRLEISQAPGPKHVIDITT